MWRREDSSGQALWILGVFTVVCTVLVLAVSTAPGGLRPTLVATATDSSTATSSGSGDADPSTPGSASTTTEEMESIVSDSRHTLQGSATTRGPGDSTPASVPPDRTVAPDDQADETVDSTSLTTPSSQPVCDHPVHPRDEPKGNGQTDNAFRQGCPGRDKPNQPGDLPDRPDNSQAIELSPRDGDGPPGDLDDAEHEDEDTVNDEDQDDEGEAPEPSSEDDGSPPTTKRPKKARD